MKYMSIPGNGLLPIEPSRIIFTLFVTACESLYYSIWCNRSQSKGNKQAISEVTETIITKNSKLLAEL